MLVVLSSSAWSNSGGRWLTAGYALSLDIVEPEPPAEPAIHCQTCGLGLDRRARRVYIAGILTSGRILPRHAAAGAAVGIALPLLCQRLPGGRRPSWACSCSEERLAVANVVVPSDGHRKDHVEDVHRRVVAP
jgi:hypothetical protein